MGDQFALNSASSTNPIEMRFEAVVVGSMFLDLFKELDCVNDTPIDKLECHVSIVA